jgi:hypothetical protein
VRTKLGQAFGAATGDAVANALFLGWMRTFNDGALLNVIRDHWIAIDDDDANLSNLTPHFAEIEAGFVSYDWKPYPDPLVSLVSGPADDLAVGHLQPVTIVAQAKSNLSTLTAARILWSTNGVTYNPVSMLPAGPPDQFTAQIPGVPSPATVTWYVDASNAVGGVANAPVEGATAPRWYHVGAVVTLQQFDFEAGSDEGWTHVNLAGSNGDQWQRNDPSASNSPDDPPAAFSPTRVWGTDLSASGTDGQYEQDSSGELRSPAFNLAASPTVRLQYRRWLSVESGQFDQASIRVNGTAVWTNPSSGNLVDTQWKLHDVNLTALAAGNPSVQIAYRLTADPGVEFGGWNIDDFRLYRVDPSPATGTFTTYGAGCPGTGGLVPQLQGTGVPTPGQNVTLTVTNGKPSGQGLLLLGTAQASVPAKIPCTLLVGGLLLPTVLPLDPAGSLVLPGTVPASAVVADVYWQFFGADSGAPNTQYSASNGLKMHVE